MPVHEDFEHAAIDQLAVTPEILRLLMAGVSGDDAVAKPAPDRWSIAEVLEHLSHVEGHLFRSRLDAILKTNGAAVEPYDEKAYDAEGAYSGRDPEDSFAHWEEQRESAIEVLRSLDEAALRRTARHPILGSFTLENMLHAWVCHDLGHVRQIAELVRAQSFAAGLGPFSGHYNLKP